MDGILEFSIMAFASLFTMMNPIGVIPVYISLTSHLNPQAAKKVAYKAVLTGLITLVLFATGIVDNCESCHDGNTAKGKADAVPAHVATSLDCHFCHTTATFVGGTWVHDASTAGNCDSCHNNNGGGATGKPNGHLSTTEQCDVCHNTNGWAPTTFSHDPNGNYPGDHRVNPSCQQCHGNTISSNIPWPHSQYAPDCAACHANDYKSGEDDHNGLSNDRNCGQSGCHRVTQREW